jgi:hypothetical protein
VIDTWRTYLGELSARQLALIGAALLLAVSGAALLWEDEPETVVTLREETAPPPTTEIAGLSVAAQKIPLRNPFSYAHETLAETFPVVENVKGDVQPPHMSAPPPPQASSVSAETASPAPPPEPLVLRGVVMDANGVRIAILAKGTESAALAVGETWQGHTLRELTDRSATLDAASGSIIVTRE